MYMKIINKDCSISMDFDTVNKIYCIKDEANSMVSLYLDDVLFQTECLSKNGVEDTSMNNLVIQLTALQLTVRLCAPKFINQVVYISNSDIQIGTIGELINLFVDPENRYRKIIFMEDIGNQGNQNVDQNTSTNIILERMCN